MVHISANPPAFALGAFPPRSQGELLLFSSGVTIRIRGRLRLGFGNEIARASLDFIDSATVLTRSSNVDIRAL